MPFSIGPFFLILAGLAAIALVIVRKFPQLTMLDVDSLPETVQKQKKIALIEERIVRGLRTLKAPIVKVMRPVWAVWVFFQERFRSLARRTHTKVLSYRITKDRAHLKEAPGAVERLLREAESALLTERFEEAESFFVHVIRLDPKHTDAYRGLGRLYMDREQWAEAREAFAHLLTIDPEDDRAWNRVGMIEFAQGRYAEAAKAFRRAIEINNSLAVRHFDLGRTYEKQNKYTYALRSYKRAVELEPGNPKYLDAFIETAILVGNKLLAKATLEKLRTVNPDNKKINEFSQRIESIGRV